jgi:hypothetical protein
VGCWSEGGCWKWERDGGTPHCAAHGGGRRCQHAGCPKSAATGGRFHYKAHGGGMRCQHVGRSKAARSARFVRGAHSRSPTVGGSVTHWGVVCCFILFAGLIRSLN